MSDLSALSGDPYPVARRAVPASLSSATAAGDAVRADRLASAVLGFACFMAVFALLAGLWTGQNRASEMAPSDRATPTPEPQTPVWIDITRPIEAFDLAGGPYARLPMRVEARRASSGPARRDVITYGLPQPGEAFARLLFDRHETGPAEGMTLFVDAARTAGSAGLAILRSGLASQLATRFGSFEVADVTVGRSDRAAPCLAFRRVGDILTIVGLMCGPAGRPVEPVTLACSLDKIDLVTAGDPALRDLFNAAEQQRGLGCSDPRAIRGSVDPLRPISSTLRGTLASGQGHELSRLR